MLNRLVTVSPRSNDAITLRRARALARTMILFILVGGALGVIHMTLYDPRSLFNTAIGLALFTAVYMINRSGRVQLALTILLVGGTLATIMVAVATGRPVPVIFFLGLVVVFAAAFGRPRATLIWAAVVSSVPFIINQIVYGAPLIPPTMVALPNPAGPPSLLMQEISAVGLFWMLAGTAYLTSGLIEQMLDESRTAASQAIAANQALLYSEERFFKVFQFSPIAISICTLIDWRIIDVNDSFLELTQYRKDEMVGHTAGELSLWANGGDQQRIHELLDAQGSVRDLEVGICTKFGTTRLALTAVQQIELAGEPCVLAMFHDITENKQLEARLIQSQKMESVGRLAGGVAHDFNNLLTVISGYTDLALDVLPATDPIHSDLQEIQKAADRAASFTRQLLAFARKQIIEPRVLNLNTLTLDMDKLLRRLIGEDIELVTQPDPNLWQVKVDPHQIEQVLINLAVNARDAMPGGGKLTIETRNVILDQEYARRRAGMIPGPYVLLAVSDTGTGIAEEEQAYLFEPFYTTKAQGKGTGLGLATCYGIIKQHGGYIEVYSELGHGTSVKVYLPQITAPPEGWSRLDDPDNLPRGSETVLLVEDEVAVRDLAARVLRGQGYTVLEAGNGEEALQVAQAHDELLIHLLLTDVVMPHMGGGALAERLTLLRPDIKVLFTSGYTDSAIVHHGQLEAGVAFLHKPFSPAALAHKVRDVLDCN